MEWGADFGKSEGGTAFALPCCSTHYLVTKPTSDRSLLINVADGRQDARGSSMNEFAFSHNRRLSKLPIPLIVRCQTNASDVNRTERN